MSEQIGSDLARRRTMGNTTNSRAAAVNEASEATSTPASLFPLQVIDGHVYTADSQVAPFTGVDGVEYPNHRTGLVALVYDERGITSEVVARAVNNHGAMLAALKELVENCDWYADNTYDREPPHMLGGYGMAKKAIANAEGGH
jgi:hypothetical protein